MADDPLRTAGQVVGRLRTQLRRASRDLAVIDEALSGERFGTFRLAAGEPLDEAELLSFLRRARRVHPEQELQITIVARQRGQSQPV
jgi:hypothetical protein